MPTLARLLAAISTASNYLDALAKITMTAIENSAFSLIYL